jgi:anti-anti-sigma factor
LVLKCLGELDLSTRSDIDKRLHEAYLEHPDTLTVDCTGLGFIAGEGVQVLVDAERNCRESGIGFALTVNPRVRRVLDAAGVWWLGRSDEPIAQ